jgi:hypothetical protein
VKRCSRDTSRLLSTCHEFFLLNLREQFLPPLLCTWRGLGNDWESLNTFCCRWEVEKPGPDSTCKEKQPGQQIRGECSGILSNEGALFHLPLHRSIFPVGIVKTWKDFLHKKLEKGQIPKDWGRKSQVTTMTEILLSASRNFKNVPLEWPSSKKPWIYCWRMERSQRRKSFEDDRLQVCPSLYLTLHLM